MLNVIYRPYIGETEGRIRTHQPDHRPDWFTKQNTYKSIIAAIIKAKEHINVFYIFYDGGNSNYKGEFYDYIVSYFSVLDKHNIKYEFRDVAAGSVFNSLAYATRFAYDNTDFDSYLVEDDYFHTEDSILKMYQALPKYKILSGYDHLRQYVLFDHQSFGGYEIKVDFDFNSNLHWRTTKTLGHSYMVSREIMTSFAKDIIYSEACIRSDWDLWQFLHNAGIPVYTSMPGILTQVDPWMSPGIDWKKENQYILNLDLFQ